MSEPTPQRVIIKRPLDRPRKRNHLIARTKRDCGTIVPRVTDPWDSALELELLRDLGRKSFWMFFLNVFGAGDNPKGERWIDPKIHEPIARWFQGHVDHWFDLREQGIGEQVHLALLVPREFGKTTMLTIAAQLWLQLRDPEISSYTGCESTTLSMKILAAMQSILDGSDPHSLWTTLYGNWATEARKWTGKAITHAARKNTARHDPSLGTFSVETSIVGAHPDALFYDDPISYERLSTDSNWLETVNSQVTSLFPVIQSDGLIVWVGTRYSDEDHFGVAFRDEGVKSLTGMETDSIIVTPEGKWHVYFLAARDAEGKPVSDKIWPERRLKDYERRDPLRYASQVMNDPSISEFNPITRDQLKQCIIPSKEVPWGSLRFAICCDTAFWSGDKRISKDETCMYVLGYPRNMSGDVYVIEGAGSNTWRAEDFGKRLVATVQRYRKQGRTIFAITDEVTMAGKKGAWRSSLRNFFSDVNEPMPPFIEFDRGGRKKVERIIAAVSLIVDGHVRFIEGSPGLSELLDQLARVGLMMLNPKMKDDRADAFSDGFQPELYHPMRRIGPQKAPWERDTTVFAVEGLDVDEFRDGDYDLVNPRPVIK